METDWELVMRCIKQDIIDNYVRYLDEAIELEEVITKYIETRKTHD